MSAYVSEASAASPSVRDNLSNSDDMEFIEVLLAQNTGAPVPFDWEKMLMFQGPLYVLFGVFVWFLLWYGPGLVQGHKDMMSKVGNAAHETAQSTKTLTETLTEGVKEIKETRRAAEESKEDLLQIKRSIKHGCAAGERFIRTTNPGAQDSDVIRELRKAQDSLDDEK